MLYLVGLGLADERDITVKGLEVVKRAERVYLEAYTAILLVDVSVLVRECECISYEMFELAADDNHKVGNLLWPSRHRGRP